MTLLSRFSAGFLALLPTARQLALAQSISPLLTAVSPVGGIALGTNKSIVRIRPVQAQTRGKLFSFVSRISPYRS